MRTIYSPSRLSSLPGYTDGGPTRDARKRAISQARADGIAIKISAKQFTLQLDEHQRSVYEKMATAYRWAYNEAVARYRTERVTDPDEWSTRKAYSVRDRVLEKARTCKWTERYPRKLLQQGAEEFTKAVKSSWALFKSKLSSARGRRYQPRRPTFKFRSRKDWTDRWRFTLPKAACTLVDGKLFLCKNTLGSHWGLKQGVVAKGQEELEHAFEKDGKPFSEVAVCKLLNGDIVLRVTCYEQAKATECSEPGNENQVAGNEESHERVAISLDPGKRTFLTGYVNGVGCGDVDADLNARLGRLYERLQKVDAGLAGRIEGMVAPPVGKRRRRLLGRRRAVESRIAAIVDDAHWKLAHWLCSVADDLVVGKFYVPGIVRGCVASSTKWILLRQRHCLFRDRLRHVASQYVGVQVHMQNEAYTSKTCTHCGKLNEGLGSSKTFHCPHCGKVFDRDANAARNIMLRWLTERELSPTG